MSEQTAAPEPGWYPDSADPALERWWDGADWSPVTRPRDVASQSGQQQPGQQQSGQQQPGQQQPGQQQPGQQQGSADSGGSSVPGRPAGPASTANPYAAPPRDQEGRAGGPGGPDRGGPGWRPDQGDPGRRPDQGGPGRRPDQDGSGRSGPARTTPDGVPLASPLLRMVARFFDSLVTGMIAAVVGLPYLQQMWEQFRPVLQEYANNNPAADMTPLLEDPAFNNLLLRYSFVALLVGGVYSVVLTHLFGGTLGKLAVGVRVRSWDEPGRPTWGQALARWLTREVICAIPYAGIGTIYLIMDSTWLLFDPRRQCLHDKLPATVVVQRF